jgi:YD repeat-containing protein
MGCDRHVRYAEQASLQRVRKRSALQDNGDPFIETTCDYNTANELTSMTADGTTTTLTYDDRGRMVTKSQRAYEATYDYRYDNRLARVTTDFPGESNEEYEYGGDGKRRSAFHGATTSSYYWGGTQDHHRYGWGDRHLSLHPRPAYPAPIPVLSMV